MEETDKFAKALKLGTEAGRKWFDIPRVMRKLYTRNARITRNEVRHAQNNEPKKDIHVDKP